jgi:lipopolysaccharide transport system ATP-binding protein
MGTVIKAENLSKQYRLGTLGTGSLLHDVNRWLINLRGKEDPYVKLDEKEDTHHKKGFVWALKDINFEVQQGEVVGFIGKNGAGKSTLLKILSRVTAPTEGTVKVKGRIASLLEVGTGFHPELTGRENIYLNAAILGMTKAEVKKNLDAIIDFSGVSKYIDTPVKRYSSGMYVRLAFAVAAHLESEILIVDEVLAVGDAEFQKKCLGKMKDVSGQGRTVLFVSHNMAAVKTLCSRGVVMEHGKVKLIAGVDKAVSTYLSGYAEAQNLKRFGNDYDKPEFILHEISLNPKGKTSDEVLDEYQEIELNTILTIKDEPERFHLTYVVNNENGEPLFTISHINANKKLSKGVNHVKCTFPKGFLNIGTYYLVLYIIQDSRTTAFVERDILSFNVQEGERGLGAWMGKEPGFIKPVFDWSVTPVHS